MPNGTIRWTRPAIHNIARIDAYLSSHDTLAAARIIDRIDKAVALLQSSPRLGRQGTAPATRELKVPRTRYLVVYRLLGDEIDILAVFHERQARPTSYPGTRD